MLFRYLALAATVFSAASAHSTFQELWVNGVDKAGTCVYLPTSNSPVTSATSGDLTCNTHTAASSKCAVTAGKPVTVEMHAVSWQPCRLSGYLTYFCRSNPETGLVQTKPSVEITMVLP